MGTDAGTAAAGSQARSSAELQQALSGLALPALREALASYRSDLGAPGSEPASIAAAFGSARSQLKDSLDQTKEQTAAYIRQQAGQSGNTNQAAINETIGNVGQQLEQGYSQQHRALQFQEAQAGLSQTNQLISNISGGAGSILGGSLKFGGNALQSDQLLSSIAAQNRQQGSTYGGVAGTILGGIAGAYFGNPVAGASLGGALGGAAGGYFAG